MRAHLTFVLLLHYPGIRFPLDGCMLCIDHGMMRPTGRLLTNSFKSQELECDVSVTKHDVINKITFSAVRVVLWSHAPWTPAWQLNRCVKVFFSSLQRLHSFQLLLGNSMHCISLIRYKF